MKVSIIGGTGPQGLGIAKRFAIEGVEVIVGSRKEEKALSIVEETIEELKDYDLKKSIELEKKLKAINILIKKSESLLSKSSKKSETLS